LIAYLSQKKQSRRLPGTVNLCLILYPVLSAYFSLFLLRIIIGLKIINTRKTATSMVMITGQLTVGLGSVEVTGWVASGRLEGAVTVGDIDRVGVGVGTAVGSASGVGEGDRAGLGVGVITGAAILPIKA